MNEEALLNQNKEAVDVLPTSNSSLSNHYNRFKIWRDEHTFLSLILEVVVLVVFVVIPVRTLVAQPFMVSGDSMLPTFTNNNYLIVNQLSQHLGGDLDRYEVVVFKYPGDDTKFYIKRLIGLPGERVVVANGEVTIYNEEYPEGLPINSDYAQGRTIGSSDLTLSETEYFVMGDNRENSSDSRFWGALPEDNIVGSPLIRVFPLSSISLNPGNVNP